MAPHRNDTPWSSWLPRVTRAAAVRGIVAVLAASMACGCAAPGPRADSRAARIEALALLQTLNADLLSHDSATLTLERWCADHHLADPARIVARRVRDAVKPIPDGLRSRLAIDSGEPIGYRRVQLVCGAQVLSEADNWYLPRRLTADMNRRLDTTDEPFGKVVQPLDFRRRTLSAELLWSPLPQGWEMAATHTPTGNDEALRVPHSILRHEAVLYTSQQVPFSALVETYTNRIFAFADWAWSLDE